MPFWMLTSNSFSAGVMKWKCSPFTALSSCAAMGVALTPLSAAKRAVTLCTDLVVFDESGLSDADSITGAAARRAAVSDDRDRGS